MEKSPYRRQPFKLKVRFLRVANEGANRQKWVAGLAVKGKSITFAAAMRLANDYNNGGSAMQRSFGFSASFNAFYLAGPNNLPIHTGERPINTLTRAWNTYQSL